MLGKMIAFRLKFENGFKLSHKSISGRMDKAYATETVDSGSIAGRVKPKTIKIGMHSFSAWRSALKGTVWNLNRLW